MKSVEKEHHEHLPVSQILEDVFSIPEVVKRSKEFEGKSSSSGEASALVFKKARELLDKAGRIEKVYSDLFRDHFITDSVRIVVDNEPVYLSLFATLEKREIDVLANIINIKSSNIPILFSASFVGHKIKVESGNLERFGDRKLNLSLGIISLMSEQLPYERKPVNPQK